MERLRHRRAFLAAARAQRQPTPAFVLQWRCRDDEGPIRVGYTVTRKTAKKAVERNRIRRRLKEAVRQVPEIGQMSGYDLVLVGRRKALSIPFENLVADLSRCLSKLPRHSLRTKGAAPAGAEH